MEKIRATDNRDIWLLGGAKLAQSFARDEWIDEIILTIIPTALGEGIALELPLGAFRLQKEAACMDGIVQKIYCARRVPNLIPSGWVSVS